MSKEIQQNNQEYGADQIQILEGLEAVRKRPGMYIGSTSSRGLHHLVYTPFLYTKLGGTEQIAGQVYEGCRNIYYAEMADPSIPILSSSVVWDARGLSKMFGLVGACLAMYHTARPENRQKIKS